MLPGKGKSIGRQLLNDRQGLGACESRSCWRAGGVSVCEENVKLKLKGGGAPHALGCSGMKKGVLCCPQHSCFI